MWPARHLVRYRHGKQLNVASGRHICDVRQVPAATRFRIAAKCRDMPKGDVAGRVPTVRDR